MLPFAPSCDLDQLERSKCGTRPSASHLANGFDRPSAHVRIAAKPAMCIAGPAMPTEACLSVWIVHPRAPATRQVPLARHQGLPRGPPTSDRSHPNSGISGGLIGSLWLSMYCRAVGWPCAAWPASPRRAPRRHVATLTYIFKEKVHSQKTPYSYSSKVRRGATSSSRQSHHRHYLKSTTHRPAAHDTMHTLVVRAPP